MGPTNRKSCEREVSLDCTHWSVSTCYQRQVYAYLRIPCILPHQYSYQDYSYQAIRVPGAWSFTLARECYHYIYDNVFAYSLGARIIRFPLKCVATLPCNKGKCVISYFYIHYSYSFILFILTKPLIHSYMYV